MSQLWRGRQCAHRMFDLSHSGFQFPRSSALTGTESRTAGSPKIPNFKRGFSVRRLIHQYRVSGGKSVIHNLGWQKTNRPNVAIFVWSSTSGGIPGLHHDRRVIVNHDPPVILIQELRLPTWTGLLREVTSPRPSRPSELTPHAHKVPSMRRATVW